MFREATQILNGISHSLGKFVELVKETEIETTFSFSNGSYCWPSKSYRSTNVTLRCGNETKFYDVLEPVTCKY